MKRPGPPSKLTDEQVAMIVASDQSDRYWAAQLNVSRATVGRQRRGHTERRTEAKSKEGITRRRRARQDRSAFLREREQRRRAELRAELAKFQGMP